jgi:hypothetical protein
MQVKEGRIRRVKEQKSEEAAKVSGREGNS